MAEVSGSGDAEHRVQAEDSERKIGRQQLVGGDKVETHKPTCSPTPTFLSHDPNRYIYIDFLNSTQRQTENLNYVSGFTSAPLQDLIYLRQRAPGAEKITAG